MDTSPALEKSSARRHEPAPADTGFGQIPRSPRPAVLRLASDTLPAGGQPAPSSLDNHSSPVRASAASDPSDVSARSTTSDAVNSPMADRLSPPLVERRNQHCLAQVSFLASQRAEEIVKAGPVGVLRSVESLPGVPAALRQLPRLFRTHQFLVPATTGECALPGGYDPRTTESMGRRAPTRPKRGTERRSTLGVDG